MSHLLAVSIAKEGLSIESVREAGAESPLAMNWRFRAGCREKPEGILKLRAYFPHPYELFMLRFLQSDVKLSISKHSQAFPDLKMALSFRAQVA
jgi:hypothetical protein